jgi:uncharacterized membrane protein YhaH (DUF805 family)
MNRFATLYMTLDGRISRKQYWFGVLLIVAFSAVVSFSLMAFGLAETVSGTGTVQVNGGPAGEYSFTRSTLTPWAAFIVTMITAYPLVAILVKRRHDRGSNGLDAKIIVPTALLVQFLGVLGVFDQIPLSNILSLALTFATIYLLIVTGFLRGTPGPNAFGPDPLAPAAPAT